MTTLTSNLDTTFSLRVRSSHCNPRLQRFLNTLDCQHYQDPYGKLLVITEQEFYLYLNCALIEELVVKSNDIANVFLLN